MCVCPFPSCLGLSPASPASPFSPSFLAFAHTSDASVTKPFRTQRVSGERASFVFVLCSYVRSLGGGERCTRVHHQIQVAQTGRGKVGHTLPTESRKEMKQRKKRKRHQALLHISNSEYQVPQPQANPKRWQRAKGSRRACWCRSILVLEGRKGFSDAHLWLWLIVSRSKLHGHAPCKWHGR